MHSSSLLLNNHNLIHSNNNPCGNLSSGMHLHQTSNNNNLLLNNNSSSSNSNNSSQSGNPKLNQAPNLLSNNSSLQATITNSRINSSLLMNQDSLDNHLACLQMTLRRSPIVKSLRAVMLNLSLLCNNSWKLDSLNTTRIFSFVKSTTVISPRSLVSCADELLLKHLSLIFTYLTKNKFLL